jgi:hypothetical protein
VVAVSIVRKRTEFFWDEQLGMIFMVDQSELNSAGEFYPRADSQPMSFESESLRRSKAVLRRWAQARFGHFCMTVGLICRLKLIYLIARLAADPLSCLL